MAGGKETPRQKMIGMMYLVLTALLAMNVSKEVLLAFAIINEGMENTNHSFEVKIDETFDEFTKAYEENPAKAGKYYEDAKLVKGYAEELQSYILELKARIFALSELKDQEQWQQYVGSDGTRDTIMNLYLFEKTDDYDSPTNMMIGDPAAPHDKPFSALELKAKLEKYRDDVKAIALKHGNEAFAARLDETFGFKAHIDSDGKEEPWEIFQFYHQTVGASFSLLSKLVGDVKATESDVIDFLFSYVGASDFRVNKIVPVVKMNSNYLAVGDSMKFDFLIAAVDTTKLPTIEYGSKINDLGNDKYEVVGEPTVVDVVGGIGRLRAKASSVGEKSFAGIIKQPIKGGGEKHYPFEFEYKIADAGAVVDPTAMNVIYAGVPNPIMVSVPGVDSDDLNVVSTKGGVSVKKTGKGYDVFIKSKTFNDFKLVVKNKKTGKSYGDKQFRVKSLPKPEPTFAGMGSSDATIKRAVLAGSEYVFAELKDFVFKGVKYEIKSFSVVINIAGQNKSIDAVGNKLPSSVSAYFKKIKAGQTVIFNNIIAVGNDGKRQKLSNLGFKVI